MKRLIPLMFLCLPFIMSCGAPSASPDEMAVIGQWSGQQGGMSTAGTRVIRTAEEWSNLWQQLGREAPRSLDVSREMGVVVFNGEKRTGGYGAEIVRARRLEETFVVEYRETAPAPDAMTTQAITYPWAVAVLPRSELPIVFENRTPRLRGASPEAPAPPERPEPREER